MEAWMPFIIMTAFTILAVVIMFVGGAKEKRRIKILKDFNCLISRS